MHNYFRAYFFSGAGSLIALQLLFSHIISLSQQLLSDLVAYLQEIK